MSVRFGQKPLKELTPTMLTNGGGSDNALFVLGLDRASFNQGANAKFSFSIYENEQPTLTAKGPGAVAGDSRSIMQNGLQGNQQSVCQSGQSNSGGGTMDNYIVRRLTPLECERLQGYPDGWTDIGDWVDSKGKTHKGDADSPRYKALGNSIAISIDDHRDSSWDMIIKRISAELYRKAKMGSLFDGIGGFPLLWERYNGAGTAVWASEIEEFPIAVTKKHFPNMMHLGDITKINGAEIPEVQCIIGGSPCQDLSVAGKRAGLDGERSGLFMEQIRIVKEMREHAGDRRWTDDVGRFLVWENVAGAYSSGTPRGEDFRIVLEEICKIADPNIRIPRCEKWSKFGCIVGDSFSVSWGTFNAANFSVPQRRIRIHLAADFNRCSPEICFIPACVPRDTEQSREEGQSTAGDSGECAEGDH